MSVVIETTLGDITVDLFLNHRPRTCLNFLKLCKIKYYNFNLFHTISRGFIAQSGDPTGTRKGGESIFGVVDGASRRYFQAEKEPRIKHTQPGLISFVGDEDNMIGSQFFLTLGEDLIYLDEKHCVFGEVVDGIDILEAINEVICDKDDRPYQDVRITHTVVLDDPYPDPKGLRVPSRSPSPSAERLAGGRIAPDEEIDETTGKSAKEIAEFHAEREAKARATILEMIGDIPDAEVAPPENVLFVCKLNPVTSDDDLEIIFSRFGKIKSCEVIRDRKTGDSLQYAFIEFEEQKSCEDAYFKMDNVLIDDRRIHVDFSQSVSKVKWLGKGRGVAYFDETGKKQQNDKGNEIGKGNYKVKNGNRHGDSNSDKQSYNKGYDKRSPKRERRSPNMDKRQVTSHKTNRREYTPNRRSRSPKSHQRPSESTRRHNYVRSTALRQRISPARQSHKQITRSRSRSLEKRKDRYEKNKRDIKSSSRQRARSKSKSTKNVESKIARKTNNSTSDDSSDDESRHKKKRSKYENDSEDSSSEEKRHRKRNKKSKKAKKKSKKKKYVSSTESSSSDSEDYRKKKCKKKKSKPDSDSD